MVRWSSVSALLLAFLGGGVGCVERLLQVRSDPQGASVYLNGKHIGETPLAHRFTFYGTVDVSLRATGHLAHRELKTLSTPWYQVFPADLFSEFFVPWTIRDVHTVAVTMTPAPRELTPEERHSMEKRADELRPSLPSPARKSLVNP